MRNIALFLLAVVLIAGCITPPQATLQPAEAAAPTQTPAQAGVTPRPAGKTPAAFTVDTHGPFSSQTRLATWESHAYRPQGDDLPVDPAAIANPGVIAGLTADHRAFLLNRGFLVTTSQDDQFYQIRERVSREYGQPYFLSADAAYHALHLSYAGLLKALEKERFRPQAIAITRAAFDELTRALPEIAGSPAEQDARQAAAYLAVALKLFEPETKLPAQIEKEIEPQLRQVQAAGGRASSALFPGFEDDYGAYKPVGHYSGDAALEAYFRGMTWFGRVHFPLKEARNPGFKPSRLPLLVTWALRRAELEDGRPAAQAWGELHEALTFLTGDSDDPGPPEYAALMDEIYGQKATILDLADETLWQAFLARSAELPAAQLNAAFVDFLSDLQIKKGWRFMGQRFTLDGFILQNLLYDRVGSPEKKREIPSALDVISALGSQAAAEAQRFEGQEDYANYPEQMQRLRRVLGQQSQEDWLSRFHSGFLYAFLAQVQPKDDAYPPYMRTAAWEYKEMNTALGAWAELKHDTALYAKMPEPVAGGGPPASGPAPAYVEPNPDVFYRLSYLAGSLVNGLVERRLVNPPDQFVMAEGGELTLDQLVFGLKQLSRDYQQLGDVAAKELAGQPLSEEDAWLLQNCLGPVECAVLRARQGGTDAALDPMPLVSAVSGAGQDEVLEAAIGNLNRIYVIVPLDGKLAVAQGGVFTYYEFTRPRDSRLTDKEWRVKLAVSPPEAPFWTANFRLPGGETADALAFRKNDVYVVTAEGANLNLRAAPSTDARVLAQLQEYDYVTIVGGPAEAEGYTWWMLRLEFEDKVGWAVEHPDWYQRAWGQ